MSDMLSRLAGKACASSLALLFAVSCAGHRVATQPRPSGPLAEGDGAEVDEVPSALARKFAQTARFAPTEATPALDDPEGFAAQDWLEHATPDDTVDFTAFATARNDWFGLKARPAKGTGAWVPLGPTNGINPANPFRDRTVYNAGTENFGGRTVQGVISPICNDEECYLWIANANGGVWRTANALAPEPEWEYVSETFEQNNVSSLELDPNDANHKTIWAGTGEPNACGSGCEVGVGVYLSKSGGTAWKGPLGAEHFFGRGVGSIEVKPGDSNTIFAASGRAGRGISNTCCGGVDQLVPGAPHFGVWRSQDEGKTWQLVNQGAETLCTATHPDVVSLGSTPCSPRGARRVKIDPVDPNTVYASFFARGIWRSRSNGDPGTWERIMAPVGATQIGTTFLNNERAEFDVVALPSGETRMYVGVGGGVIPNPMPPPATIAAYARFRRNDAVRNAPGAGVQAGWIDLTSNVPDTPGYSSFGYCDGQCSYDNYVYAPAAHAPNSGANPDIVYLLGDNEYDENNGPEDPLKRGRSNGRAVLLSTNAGVTFTDMTEDASGGPQPGALHPDHHALVTNPNNWMQFFDLGDGGVARSNGVFVDDSDECATNPRKMYVGTRLTFCQMVLSRVPQRLNAINKGLRTLHVYEMEYDRKDPERIALGTQDNGSWETLGDRETWVNVNVADGGHNAFDPAGGDPEFALTAFQAGQLSVRYRPLDQVDVNWIADTLVVFPSPYRFEGVPFIGNAITDTLTPGWMWTGREHVFRSTNWGRNPVLTKDTHRLHCNVWTGDGDVDNNGTYDPVVDICDDWKPLGDPGPNGRLTSATYGTDRAGGHVAVLERGKNDTNTLWAATSTGRVFISKNADNPVPAAVTFTRLDSTDTDDPPRYPTAIFVDPDDANHAWITYSGYNAKTPATPGHVFEIRYVPAAGSTPASGVFTLLDGHKINGYGDIPANSIIVSKAGTLYVGNDYGVVQKQKNSSVWHLAAAGLPNVNVPDLVYVPEKDVLYAGTHGQGVWQLKVQ
jgi:hypothetical protein